MYADTILYGPGPFGSGDWKYLLEPYYKNDDENEENQLGELFEFCLWLLSPYHIRDKKNPYLVRYDIDKGNELTKKIQF